MKIEHHGGYTDIRHDGRTVQLIIFVNTSEDKDALCGRVCEMIKNTGCCPMVVGAALENEPEKAIGMWLDIIENAEAEKKK